MTDREKDIAKANYIANEAQKRGIPLCLTEDEWWQVASMLADLGEDGRQPFLVLAAIGYEDYSEQDSNRQFNYWLRKSYASKGWHFGSLIHRAKERGIELPKDLKDYKATYTTAKSQKPVRQIKPLPKICYEPYLRCRTRNNFINGLINEFGTYDDGSPYEDGLKVLRKVYKDYKLCSSVKNPAMIVFFQIDKNKMFRYGKTMLYKSDLHRVRKEDGNLYGVGTVHTEQHIDGSALTQCLFGEHLLTKYPDAVVFVVESEKSAIVGAIMLPAPEYLWVAMGGHHYDLMQSLGGRDVILLPDADEWEKNQSGLKKARKEMAHVARTFIIDDWAKDEPPGSKKDVADYLLEDHRKPKLITPQLVQPPSAPHAPSTSSLLDAQQSALWEAMKKKNSNLQLDYMHDVLKLEFAF